jgi:RimJ/RimL family protein N-acetyltransferase
VGLLFRPTPGTAPVAASAGPDRPGLVFQPEAGIVGLGYWVLERARGRGLASSAVSLLVEWALGTAGLRRVEALVEPDNVASQRVLGRAGLEQEGRLRSYLAGPDGATDALIYARVRDPS